MGHKSDTPDARVARIAERQHGIVTLAQLEEAGVTRDAVYKRARRGRLHRLHRGVYAVGHRAPNHHSRWMAAVLACGEGAVLSHHSAAALWELLRPIEGPVHVSVPTTSGRTSRRGIHLHRVPSLSSSSNWQGGGREGGHVITRRHRIPVTSIQRTIDDLDGTVAPYLLRRAKRQAELRRVRLKGVEGNRSRSDLEEDFLALLLRDRQIPPPETNVKIGRHEVDFLWRDRRLVVETDSFTYHQGSVAFEADYARELDLRQQGYTVLRFTDLQIEGEPSRVVSVIREALS